jgi:hypothetical protein
LNIGQEKDLREKGRGITRKRLSLTPVVDMEGRIAGKATAQACQYQQWRAGWMATNNVKMAAQIPPRRGLLGYLHGSTNFFTYHHMVE